MQTPLNDALRHASLSIIGMSKNAGKTTVLGCLIRLLKAQGRTPALTSIGRDGERIDVVTGTAKPGIWVYAGTLIATAADLLRSSDITREILDTTGVHTPLGEVIVLRALSDGEVELAGPSAGAQMAALVQRLSDAGAQIVLVDGALSRKSLAAPTVSEATILCAGASYHPDIDITLQDTAYACALLTLPAEKPGGSRQYVIDGAATETVLRGMKLLPGDTVLARDSSCILLSRMQYERFHARGIRFAVQRPTKLCCVCINPFSASGPAFDAAAFRERMQEAVQVPVVDVREVC